MGRASDWSPLDMDSDPTPGDPSRIERLGNKFSTFADDVFEALGKVRALGEDGTLASFVGESADAYQDKFDKVPPNLEKLYTSYDLAGQALLTYAPKLEDAQRDADQALTDAEDARAELSTAQSWLERATSTLEDAEEEAEPPDEEEVSAQVRRALSDAQLDAGNARTAVDDAQEKLNAAIALAQQAREAREEAAERCMRDLEEASDAGMQNKKWWQKAVDWVVDNWDTIVDVCKVIVAVVGIIAMIIGGPLALLVLAAALIVLADTLIKYANGEASLWDVAFAALDCIPGMKGLTTAAGLLKGIKSGMKGLAAGAKGLGQALRRVGRAAGGKVCKTDPVDMATGEVILSGVDMELPGVLPLVIERHHVSGYRDGRLFGPSWASTLDQRLVLDPDGVRFFAADGMILDFPVPSADPEQTVLPVEGPRYPLSWDGRQGGTMTVRQPETGRVLSFAPVPGRPSGQLPLTAVTDRNGNRIELRHDDQGEPCEAVHSGGYRVGITVADGRVTGLRLLSAPGSPHVVGYGYDPAGNLSEIFNSSGLPLRFRYDREHRITGWEDRNNTWYRYTYDAAGRCVATDGTGGYLASRIAYDDEGHRTLFTDALGHTTVYRFNDSFQLLAETDPLGNTVHREWDRYDRLLSLTDALGRTQRYEYDDEGRLSAIVRPDGTAGRFEYNELGLPTRFTGPDGAPWRQEYDPRGNRTAAVDPAGNRTSFAYHPGGGPAAITDATGQVTRIRCDRAGLPVAVTDPQGATRHCQRDAFGRPLRVTEPDGTATAFEWDIEGLLLRRTDPLGGTHRWEWDAEGNLLARTDGNGATTRYEYGPFDLPTAHIGPDGARHTFHRDGELRLVRVTDPQGRSWDYFYDAAGRQSAESDFDDRVTTFDRDAAGHLTARTAPTGQSVHYTYDICGRLTAKTTSDGATTRYTLDAAGRVVSASSPGTELRRTFDVQGNMLSETVNGRTLTFDYDVLGRPLTRTTPSGHTTGRGYRPDGASAWLATGGRRLEYDRDTAGRETARRIDDALLFTWDRDAAGRPAGERIVLGGRTLYRRGHVFRADGAPAALTEPAGDTRFSLDPAGRVTGVAGPGGRQESYSYDPSGNQLAAHWHIPGPPEGNGEPTEDPAAGPREYTGTLLTRAGRYHYRHDAAGRITMRRRTRLSRRPDVWRYEWDAEDRLTRVTTPDGTTWTYLYDPFGRRIAKQRLASDGSVAEQTLFTWDTVTLAEQTTRHADRPGTETVTWDHEGLVPVAQTELRSSGDSRTDREEQEEFDRRFYAIVSDLVGAPTHLIDPDTGEIAWQSGSTLWGADTRAADPQAAGTPLRFPGQYADPETGWHYNFHRHYDPATARYTAPDPLGLLPAPNPHSYVTNPHTAVDPLGLSPCMVDLYHATLSNHAATIRRNGIDPGFSTRPTDFGRGGFYVTNDLGQASDWARKLEQRRGGTGEILHFRVPRSELEALNRKVFDGASAELADFIKHHRNGGGMHNFDLVEGPMVMNPRPFASGRADPVFEGHQIAIFSPEAAALFNRSLQ
ncbi:DUF6531 domain-containing protein [Streptomyces aidingensis]|uniref:RHS repeat-associated core domain-containing protein n=1 Tax=Streptomyces aidingensis TaxID=910347 RepID=A0A1I1HUX7_9ACTN|nr:DUF6531 domain-containing protein [Streptomyces aidingensis]SFC27691.1 RHS repeat-associated core domain-containing protein [Streptomyces aidingensis]